MSLIVTISVPEGIVIAGDSRTTQTWIENITSEKDVNSTDVSDYGAKTAVHSTTVSDSATKIFVIKKKFAIATVGAASVCGLPISVLIGRFADEKITGNTTVEQIPQLLVDFFINEYGQPDTNFCVIGYKIETGTSVPHIYQVNIHDKSIARNNFANGQPFVGASWHGEPDVLNSIFYKAKIFKTGEWQDVPYSEFEVESFTLQDAIDFAFYAISTTMQTMRFKKVEKTVGGPIDILIIKPKGAPIWIKQKVLKSV